MSKMLLMILWPFVSMAGLKDFNYHEMISFHNAVNNNPHIYIETSNTHEWPPVDAMKMALEFEMLKATAQNRMAKDSSLVQQWHTEWKNNLSHIEKRNDINLLHQTLQNAVSSFSGLASVTEWQQHLNAVEKSDAYKKYVSKQNELIFQEKEIQKTLNDAFANQNILWWEKEISDLKIGEKQTKDLQVAGLFSRLLGYIGIASYSYCKQMVNENQKEAEKVLSIYKTAEPDNSEAWFLSAVYNANNNQNEQALKDYKKAVEKGFKEQSRINDYPRLKNLIAP